MLKPDKWVNKYSQEPHARDFAELLKRLSSDPRTHYAAGRSFPDAVLGVLLRMQTDSAARAQVFETVGVWKGLLDGRIDKDFIWEDVLKVLGMSANQQAAPNGLAPSFASGHQMEPTAPPYGQMESSPPSYQDHDRTIETPRVALPDTPYRSPAAAAVPRRERHPYEREALEHWPHSESDFDEALQYALERDDVMPSDPQHLSYQLQWALRDLRATQARVRAQGRQE